MTDTIAYSAPTVPPRDSTQAMKVNGPCAAAAGVYIYTHENFFLICSSASKPGDWRESPLRCIVTPFWDWDGSTGQNRMGVESWGRGQIVNGGVLLLGRSLKIVHSKSCHPLLSEQGLAS